eukprot:scaffold281481_cov32-Tisochrysis_lutea.AAC.1
MLCRGHANSHYGGGFTLWNRIQSYETAHWPPARLLPLADRLGEHPTLVVASIARPARPAGRRPSSRTAKLVKLGLRGSLTAKEAAKGAKESALARKCVQGVVALLPLRVDQKNRSGARRAGDLRHALNLFGGRLDEADSVILGARALGHPDRLPINSRLVQPLLLERGWYTCDRDAKLLQQLSREWRARGVQLHDASDPRLIRWRELAIARKKEAQDQPIPSLLARPAHRSHSLLDHLRLVGGRHDLRSREDKPQLRPPERQSAGRKVEMLKLARQSNVLPPLGWDRAKHGEGQKKNRRGRGGPWRGE